MNRTVLYAAAFTIGVLARHIVREVQHQKEIKKINDSHESETSKNFLEAHSMGYQAGERAAVIDYAPSKYDELIEAQKKRP